MQDTIKRDDERRQELLKQMSLGKVPQPGDKELHEKLKTELMEILDRNGVKMTREDLEKIGLDDDDFDILQQLIPLPGMLIGGKNRKQKKRAPMKMKPVNVKNKKSKRKAPVKKSEKSPSARPDEVL